MTTLPDLIGLSGYAGSGKDTLARLLAQRHGYRVVHFADPLREMARRLNPIIGVTDGGILIHWASVEEIFGYAAAKAHPKYGLEFRGVLQRLGTEAGRGVLGDDVWVDATFRTIEPGDAASARSAVDIGWRQEVQEVSDVATPGCVVGLGRKPVHTHASGVEAAEVTA